MRVLVHATAVRMGGARTHLRGLLPELQKVAPEIRVLLLAQSEVLAELGPLPEHWGVRADRAQDRGLLGRFAWEQTALARTAEQWRADVLLSYGTFIPLRSKVPTVLHASNALPFSRQYWLALRSERPRVRVEESLRWLLLRASLQRATRVLVPSHSLRLDLARWVRGSAEQVDVAPLGVDARFRAMRWQPEADAPILGLSKHGINKEFDVLVEALASLSLGKPLPLWLTGSNDESRWARRTAELARIRGVGERVRFLGDVPHEAVPDLIARSRLVVFPTWAESFGLPLLEAMAVGAPTVAGDIPACREVGGDTPYYYRPGDPESLADAIRTALEDPEGEKRAERGRERAAAFTWRRNAEGTWRSLLLAIGKAER